MSIHVRDHAGVWRQMSIGGTYVRIGGVWRNWPSDVGVAYVRIGGVWREITA